METPITAIGEKLKSIRAARNLSLDEVSKLTSVSKPMLGQIERGQSSPTITLLWKIATGLKTPLSSFFGEQQSEYTVVDIETHEIISEDHVRMTAYPLFTYDPIRNVEIFYIEFDTGCHHESEKHNDGVEEYVLVLTGKLQIGLNNQELTIGEKQAIRFRADIPHTYNNPYNEPCTAYNIIFYPNH